MMELNPVEAITNNVAGTRNLLEVSTRLGVERFVMVSSDKAVNPTSIMGASKRVAELLTRQAALRTGAPYVAVRFGNVLGSRGSVIPTFQKQIKAGGPVTVTHPEMKRYFMTIPEAVQLLLQAAALGQGGEVFMLDMGESVKIADLARDVIELSGLEVGRDIELVYTGIRPGEKLFEELFIEGEDYRRTAHGKIFVVAGASDQVPASLTEAIEQLEGAAIRADERAVVAGLRLLVPEFQQPPPAGSVEVPRAPAPPAVPQLVHLPDPNGGIAGGPPAAGLIPPRPPRERQPSCSGWRSLAPIPSLPAPRRFLLTRASPSWSFPLPRDCSSGPKSRSPARWPSRRGGPPVCKSRSGDGDSPPRRTGSQRVEVGWQAGRVTHRFGFFSLNAI